MSPPRPLALSNWPGREVCTSRAAPLCLGLSQGHYRTSLLKPLRKRLSPWPPLCRYAKDGVLLPTVSNRVRTSPAEIEEYFSNFLTLQPQGKIDHSNVRLLAEDTAINSGVYTFDLVKDGKPTKVQARYSFTYKRLEDGQWYIVDHHSSGMPEAVVDNDLDDVAKQFDRWNAALQTLDPIQVAAL